MRTAVEVLLVLLLIVANGLFSMPETAVVSAQGDRAWSTRPALHVVTLDPDERAVYRCPAADGGTVGVTTKRPIPLGCTAPEPARGEPWTRVPGACTLLRPGIDRDARAA